MEKEDEERKAAEDAEERGEVARQADAEREKPPRKPRNADEILADANVDTKGHAVRHSVSGKQNMMDFS